MYKLEDFLKGDFGIYCDTVEEKQTLLQKLDDLGIKWACGVKPLEFTYWSTVNGFVICRGALSFGYSGNDVNFEEVDFGGNSMFTKDNLEVGQFVALRDGRRFLVLKTASGKIYLSDTESCFVDLDGFNNDLTHKTNTNSDIMKVCLPAQADNLDGILHDFTFAKFVWERENIKEMTLEEVNKIMQEVKGYKVKIIE